MSLDLQEEALTRLLMHQRTALPTAAGEQDIEFAKQVLKEGESK